MPDTLWCTDHKVQGRTHQTGRMENIHLQEAALVMGLVSGMELEKAMAMGLGKAMAMGLGKAMGSGKAMAVARFHIGA